MKDYARSFYKSRAWKDTQAAYMVSQHYICERCGDVARVVHHRKYIKSTNINDPSITLDWANLEALCYGCHAQEHNTTGGCSAGFAFDENGEMVPIMNCVIVCGAPASGKTTYVQENKKPGDLVLDLDYIGAALTGDLEGVHRDHTTVLPVMMEVRETVCRCIRERRGKWRTAFVITAHPDLSLARMLAKDLNASIQIMDCTAQECKERISRDSMRSNKDFFYKIIDKWYAENPGECPPASSP